MFMFHGQRSRMRWRGVHIGILVHIFRSRDSHKSQDVREKFYVARLRGGIRSAATEGNSSIKGSSSQPMHALVLSETVRFKTSRLRQQTRRRKWRVWTGKAVRCLSRSI